MNTGRVAPGQELAAIQIALLRKVMDQAIVKSSLLIEPAVSSATGNLHTVPGAGQTIDLTA